MSNPEMNLRMRRFRAVDGGACRLTRFVVAICLLACGSSSATAFARGTASFPCSDNDKDCAAKAAKDHVVTTLKFWNGAFAKPVEARVGSAPPELVQFLRLQNIKDGFPNKPRAAPIAPAFLRYLRAAIAELPDTVKRSLSGRLAGIHLIDDLGGTGFTDMVFDDRSNAAAGFVVLDAAVLNAHTANSWASWKDNRPFKAQPGFRMAVRIEEDREDNRKNAIQYILLHELGHVLAINEKVHPPWNLEPKEITSIADFPFARLSWAIEGDRYATKFDASFPQRKDLVFYLGARLKADQMLATYDSLERTNFPSLYAATSPGDDFAEAFASYVHTVLMKKPYQIRIYRDGRIVKTVQSCWEQARCAEKRKLLERILAGP